MKISNTSWAAKLTLVLFGIIISLIISELVVRFLYQKPWYESLVEEQILKNDGLDPKIKFRNQKYSSVKPDDHRRVLVLGDSFTFGAGIKDPEKTFSAILEKRLNCVLAIPQIKHVEVYNGGIAASLTGEWVELWKTIYPDYKPDYLLIVFFLRDGTRTGSIPAFFEVIRDDLVLKNIKSSAYQYSYLFRFLKDRFDKKKVAEKYTHSFIQSYFGNAKETEEWRIAQSNILLLRDMAHSKSIPVGFVIFPILADLKQPYVFQPIVDLLEKFAIENKLPVHNLLPAFIGKKESELWVSPYNQHPSEIAHVIAAESMLPFVVEMIRVKSGNR